MPIRNLADLRQWAGEAWKDASDEDLVSVYAKQANMPLVDVANAVGYDAGSGGMTAKRTTASISNYAAGMQGLGEAVAGGLGFTGAEEYLAGKRRANEVQAQVALGRAQKMGAVESYKDVDTVGEGFNYAGGLLVGSAPYAIEAATGGIGARALMGGTRLALTEARAALEAAETARDAGAIAQATQAVNQAQRSLNVGSMAGGAAASYPSAVGDILQNQREQTGGQTDIGAAGLLGVPYAALNALGVGGALAKGSLFRNTINMLDRPGGVGGALLRTGATATSTGLKEGASETGQEMLNQAGRMAVDDKAQFFDQDAIGRYKESFVGGAVLGGALGGGLGGYRRSEGYQATGDIQQAFTQPQTSGTPITGQTPPAAGATVVPPVTPNAPAGGANVPAGGTGASTAPVVSGGTTAIAQASAGQTQADFAAQQQQAIQEKREVIIDQFGLRSENPTLGQFFNQSISATNINRVADALGPIAAKLDKEDAAVMDAILRADKLTGGKLVNFKFNGDKIEQSVQQGVKAVLSVANKFQIGEVESVAEAGQILNALSQSAKGAELEQVNAIHQALTGKDTEGYIASQTAKTAKGKPNAQQQQQLSEQVPAGLGTVPEQGSAGQVDGGLTGLLQPGAVQPVGTGSVAGAAPDQQAGQPSGEGVRPSASIAADNGSDVLNVAPQIIGAPSETSTVQTTAVQGGAVASAGVDGGGQISGQSSQATESDVDRPVVQRRKRRAIIGAQQYTPGLQYYASDLSHISSERRVEIVQQLLDIVFAPKREGTKVISARIRGEIARLALNEQFRMEQIAEFTGVSAEAVSKQLQRMGIALKDGEFQVIDPEFAKLLVATAEAFRSAEFPDGIGIVELKGLYATRYEGKTQSTSDLAEELQTAEPEGDRSKVLAEELYGGESGEGKSMGTIASAGSSQGAVDSAGARGLSKITMLQTRLDSIPDTDVEGKADVAKQLAVAWERYKKEQKVRAAKGEIEYTQEEEEEQDLVGETTASKKPVEEETTTEAKKKRKENLEQTRVARQAERKGLEVGDTVVNPKLGTGVVKSFAGNKEDTRVTVEFKSGVTKELLVSTAKLEKTNAVQVKSTNEGDVREPAAGGEEVVKADTEPKKPARTRKAKAESKPAPEAKEEVKTPEEQWSALAEQFPQMPPYATLDKNEKERWDDLANRGVANLAAANKLLSAAAEAAPVETTEEVVEPIAEATVEEEVAATPEAAEITPEQQAVLEEPVAALPEPQIQRLENHYDAKRGTSDFFAKLQADVVLYSTKGAEAVVGAIRDIIKAIHTGVLAVAMVFNPAGLTNNFDFNLPQTYKTTVTTQVKAKVPANAKAKMSTLAQSVYESMAPTAKASGKGFIIADKPNGMLHVFLADGSMLVQDTALYGKDIGDVEGKVSSLAGGAKITPAGKFTLVAMPSPEYPGGKTLVLAETAGDGIIAVHAAYLGDPKEKRLARLAMPGAEGKRISYGCINTKHDTFLKSILPNIDTLNGGMIFVLPDNQAATAAMFPAKTTTKVFEGTRQTATQVAARSGVVGKEEKYLFGKDGAVQNSYTAASLTAELKNFVRADIIGSKLTIVNSVDDLVNSTDPAVRAVGSALKQNEAYGVAANGKAFLIANRIEQGQGRAKFMHEVGAHLGLENLLPKAVYNKLASQIDTWAKSASGSVESTLARAAQARVEAANTPTEDRQAEMLAYFVEEAVQAGVDPTTAGKESPGLASWFRTMLNAFKVALRSLGFKTEALTAQDIVNLAFGAAQLQFSRRAATSRSSMKFGFAGEKGVRTRGMTEKQTTNMVTAKVMDANGELRSDIWYDTGWLRGVDNKWRTEFSDKDAKMTFDKVVGVAGSMVKLTPVQRIQSDTNYRLGDILSHLSLYRLYPELADYTVTFHHDIPAKSAGFDPVNKRILMSMEQPDDVATLLHEVQHAIQEIEGFGRGGSPDMMDVYNVNAAEKFYKLSAFRAKTDAQEVAILNYYRAVQAHHIAETAYSNATSEEEKDKFRNKTFYETNPARREAFQNMLTELDTTEEQVQQEMYLLISGEVEARDVEARREYNNELRRQVVPGEGEGLPYDTQLVFDKNTGTYKSIGKSLDTRAQEQVEKLPPKWQPAARTVTTTLMYTLKKAGLASMITEDVINAASKYMKSAQDYLAAQYARQATRLQHELKIDKILQQFDKLPENLKGTGKGSVNEYIHDSTRQGLWGYYPDARLVGTSMAQIDPEFKRRFNAFPKAAQDLIKATFEQGHDSLAAKQKAVADAIDREYADRIAAVQGDAELTEKFEKEKSLRLAREAKLLGLDSSKPYAYLGRYGDYVVVGKSAEYKFHEEQAKSGPVVKGEYLYGADSRQWLEDNRSNPAHYVVQFAETLAEADQIAAQLNATGNYDIAESFEKEPYGAQGGELFTAVARLRSLYDRESDGADPKAAAAISNLLGDLYLHTVSEASARKSEFQRLNISGADKDMMRNLATRGRADAHFLAALKHNDAISDSLSNMRKERDRNRREANPYFNELLNRHASSMEYQTPGGLATALQRMSTVWYLSTNPAFYLQQILQTGAISLPYMAGRLGYFRSARAVKRAYGDMATLTKGLGLTDHVDFDQAPADVRDMLKALVGMGKIDIGIDYDARSRAGDTGVVASVMNKLQGVNNRIETINRATAAIAAYRGYLERYKNNDTAAATKYAADVVSNTHGSYDAFNTPRIMSGPAGKVLLQFKRFQIIQISMLAKLLNTAFKGASAQERTVARHSLAFIAGQMGVLGGLMGVPLAQQAASILSKIFGDPDEPDNWEYKLRQMIGDKAVADLLISGVPAAMGVDVSGKIGLGNVFSILPYTDVDLASRAGAEKVLVGLMGPSANLGLKFADGLGLMAQGQYYKGLEQMLPNGVANLMKGTRFAAEGITMRNGDVVLKPDEISMLDAAFQAVGLPTNTITDRQFTQKVVKEFDKYYAERTTEIKGDYVKASRSGDSAAMSDARDEWVKLQESRIANGYKRQPYSELYRAPMEALKRERNTAGGVEFGKSNRRLVESLSE